MMQVQRGFASQVDLPPARSANEVFGGLLKSAQKVPSFFLSPFSTFENWQSVEIEEMDGSEVKKGKKEVSLSKPKPRQKLRNTRE